MKDVDVLAKEIHFKSRVVDCHNDTMSLVIDETSLEPKVDLGEGTNFHIDISKARKGGLDLGYFAAFVEEQKTRRQAEERVLALINALYFTENKNKGRFKIVKSIDEIEKNIDREILLALPTIEGAYSIGQENYRELLLQYYDLGIRLISYVWNQNNMLAAGTLGEDEDGFTDLGVEFTKLMNELGILIDVSHMNEKSFWDSIKYSTSPIIASHSCADRLTRHVRNLKDDQILALKDCGGIVNINFYWRFLGEKEEEVDVKTIADHIDYVVDLVGVDYVGLGSDFDGASMPKDIASVRDLPKLTEELIRRGYSREDIEKILGKNNLRLLKEVEEKSSYLLKNNIVIDTKFSMGDRIDNIFDLKARIGEENIVSEIIIDGLVRKSRLDKGYLSIDGEIDLEKGYHVISFKLVKDGDISRKTIIFKYI